MSALWFAFRECLWRLRWTFPVTLLITGTAMLAFPDPPVRDAAAGHTQVLWLHLPSFLVTAVVLAAVVEVWPLFARGRPGADQVARMLPGRFGGCCAASGGALLSLVASLLATGLVFAGLSGVLGERLPALHTQHRLTDAPVFLDAGHPELHIDGPPDAVVAEILLRPRSVLTRGAAFEATGVRITADGETLHDGQVQLGGQLEDVRVRFAPRRIDDLVIRRAQRQGNPLLFGPDSVRAVEAAGHGWALGCAAGASTYLLPAALALAVACLLRQRVALPIAVIGMLAVLVASTALELTPNSRAITALARGRWFPGEGVLQLLAPTGVAVAVVMAAAGALRGRR